MVQCKLREMGQFAFHRSLPIPSFHVCCVLEYVGALVALGRLATDNNSNGIGKQSGPYKARTSGQLEAAYFCRAV